MASFLRTLASVLLLCLGPLCSAQELTVRVIDAPNGHPLKGQTVTVGFLYDKNYDKMIPSKHEALKLETDTNGEIRFQFPEPRPTHFSAQIHLDESRWECRCAVLGSTEDLIGKGIVASSSRTATLTPIAGQLLFVVRPLSLFERLIYPIMKE